MKGFTYWENKLLKSFLFIFFGILTSLLVKFEDFISDKVIRLRRKNTKEIIFSEVFNPNKSLNLPWKDVYLNNFSRYIQGVEMINQTTKDKIEALHQQYIRLAKGNESLLKEITLAEIPEMVYNSNAIENSTLTLEDTEKNLSGDVLNRKVNVRGFWSQKFSERMKIACAENLFEVIDDVHYKVVGSVSDLKI